LKTPGVGFGAGFLIFAAVSSAGMGLVGSEEPSWVLLPFVAGSLLFGAAGGMAQESTQKLLGIHTRAND